jgi:hypothetical protein
MGDPGLPGEDRAGKQSELKEGRVMELTTALMVMWFIHGFFTAWICAQLKRVDIRLRHLENGCPRQNEMGYSLGDLLRRNIKK